MAGHLIIQKHLGPMPTLLEARSECASEHALLWDLSPLVVAGSIVPYLSFGKTYLGSMSIV